MQVQERHPSQGLILSMKQAEERPTLMAPPHAVGHFEVAMLQCWLSSMQHMHGFRAQLQDAGP